MKMRGTPVTGEGCEGSAGNQNGAVSDLWLGGLVRPSRLACSPQTEGTLHPPRTLRLGPPTWHHRTHTPLLPPW